MDFPTKEVMAAVVTLTVAAIGYLQWRRGKRAGHFIEDRETAYKSVWAALEEVHLYVRTQRFEHTAFDSLVTSANALLIRNGLHIDDADKGLTSNYLEALRRLGRLLAHSKLGPEAERELATTGAHVAMPPELLDSYSDYQAARQLVLNSFRRALGAGQI